LLDELESTGEFTPDDFNVSGDSVKVMVDKNGKGELKK
jgi:hypothetical protein